MSAGSCLSSVTPDGSRLYVAHSVHGTVWVIDTATKTPVGSLILVGGNPHDVAISPDGAKVYVSNFNSQSVSVIDTASNTIEATIPVGFFPLGVDTSPDGTRLYVVDIDPVLNNGSVAVIDTRMNAVMTRVTLPPSHTARRVAITPDGTRGYVTINTPTQVLVFDTASNLLVGDTIPVLEGLPEGIAITPATVGNLPFASLSATLHVRPRSRNAFSAMGTFVLGDGNDGIHLESEVVRLSISDATGVLLDETLAGGSFKQIARDDAIFHSSRNGSGIQMLRVTAEPEGGVYRFQVLADKSAVPDSNEPRMTLSLQIGNDTGSAVLTCRRRGARECR